MVTYQESLVQLYERYKLVAMEYTQLTVEILCQFITLFIGNSIIRDLMFTTKPSHYQLNSESFDGIADHFL